MCLKAQAKLAGIKNEYVFKIMFMIGCNMAFCVSRGLLSSIKDIQLTSTQQQLGMGERMIAGCLNTFGIICIGNYFWLLTDPIHELHK